MKLCAHPDDPPIEYLKGTFRPLTSVEGMRKLLTLVDSPANCLEFCQATVSTMRGIDIYAAIEEFAPLADFAYPPYTVEKKLREYYTPQRPHTDAPPIPQPYDTFADTFSYGI